MTPDGRKRLVFNGDFHWFDADPAAFARVQQQVLEHEALRGNVETELAVASGSACRSSTLRPSHVLAAMGVLTQGNVRVTLPLAAVSPTREADVDRLCAVLPEVVASVRDRLGTSDL